MKRIVMTGGTGLVGKKLTEKLLNEGYAVTVVTRSIPDEKSSEHLEFVTFDSLEKLIDGAYGVVNLAGASIVGKRWTEEYKKVLRDSRIETTKKLVAAIQKAQKKPKVLVSASAMGYYGMLPKAYGFVESDPAGMDFLARICVDWEKEAGKAETFGTRVVTVRSGIILDTNEGALPQMVTPFSYYVGGPIGSGTQPFPWIHITDEVNIFFSALETASWKGPINAVAPDQVTQKEFSNALGKALKKPSLIPVPPFVLKLLYGQGASVITSGVVIVPEKLKKANFTFSYPKLGGALRNLLSK